MDDINQIPFNFDPRIGMIGGIASLTGLMAAERRAVAIEVAFQQVALAIGLGITFFPSLADIAAVSILWGIVHLILGTGVAFLWNRIKTKYQENRKEKKADRIIAVISRRAAFDSTNAVKIKNR